MLYTDDAIIKRKKKTQAFKKNVTIIAYILVTLMLIYNISLIIQAFVNPSKTPSFLGIKAFTIISGSMEPEIQVNDIVVVKESTEEELQEGDIISFRQGQGVVTHRIVKIEKSKNKTIYKTKGDNNNTEDKIEIDIDLIEGKVIGRIPFFGKLSRLLQGKISIIVIIIMIYIYFSHINKVNHKKNSRKAKRMKYEEMKKLKE